MLYYLDENKYSPSWAGGVLSKLRYDAKPYLLQKMIRQVYLQGTKGIKIAGTRVVPVPLFRAMDGKDPHDYVARVEPSEVGRYKLAQLIWSVVRRELEKEA